MENVNSIKNDIDYLIKDHLLITNWKQNINPTLLIIVHRVISAHKADYLTSALGTFLSLKAVAVRKLTDNLP